MANPPLENRLSPSGPVHVASRVPNASVIPGSPTNVENISVSYVDVSVYGRFVHIRGNVYFEANAAGAKSFSLQIPVGADTSSPVQRWSIANTIGFGSPSVRAVTAVGSGGSADPKAVTVLLTPDTLGGAASGGFGTNFEVLIELL